MKKTVRLLITLILFFSLVTSPILSVSAQATPPDFETPVRPEPKLLPQEILDAFEGGMSIEEFLIRNKGPVPNALREYADIPVMVVVRLESPSLIERLTQRGPGIQDDIDQANYVDRLSLEQDVVIQQVAEAIPDAVVISRYTKVYNGFMTSVPAKDLETLRSMPGVIQVSRAPEHYVDLGASIPLIGADDAWYLGTGYTGKGVTIAVIDTGIDYTHAMFGTRGNPADYANNDPDIIEAGSFPTPKVIGGYDFAGTNYDASGESGSKYPTPDNDPLDEQGHGTHVASTAAGVDAGYGPGVAPDAKLYALKVFGASGSTNLTLDAIEWAMDPNGDGYIDDHVDVINMSLGVSFGIADENDPEYIAVENANRAGVFVVASAGNAANESYISGSPANTDSALSVASSTTGSSSSPYLSYHDGADIMPYNTSQQAFNVNLTAELVDVDSIDGDGTGQMCDPDQVADGALAGKIALIIRGDCTFHEKIYHAQIKGAIGVVAYNNQDGPFGMNTSGDNVLTIPAGSILQSEGLILKGLAPLTISIGPDSRIRRFASDQPADTISAFSSRGPRGVDSMLKPEITAPGTAIFAAEMGGGSAGTSMSGTSMSAPHMAGVVALMRQKHPNWSNEQIKAALMNTSVDLADDSSKQVPRQGAGRVDVLAALETDVVAVGDPKFVSLNWGVVKVTDDSFSSTKTVTLRNYSNAPVTLTFDSSFTNSDSRGATLTTQDNTIEIPANKTKKVDITLELDMTQMPLAFGNYQVSSNATLLEEYYGYVTFTNTETKLRLPFYFVPRPYTELTEESADLKFSPSDTDYGYVDFKQSGPKASFLWPAPVTIVSDNNPNVMDAADLRYVGVDYHSNNDDFGIITTFTFAMWGDQHSNQPYWSEVNLYIDSDQDGNPDFVDFNYNYAAASGEPYPNNDWIVLRIDLNTGNLGLASGASIYADYNSGVQEWYLFLEALHGVTDKFDYAVISFDQNQKADVAGGGSFDITKQPLWFNIVDENGQTDLEPHGVSRKLVFGVDSLDGYQLSQPKGIMLIDYFGNPGVGQAYFWPLELVLVKISSDDMAGPFLVTREQEFNVKLENHESGVTYQQISAEVKMAGATLATIEKIEVQNPLDASQWAGITPELDGSDGIKAGVGPYPADVYFAPGAAPVLKFRITFAEVGEFETTGSLYDASETEKPVLLASYTDTMVVKALPLYFPVIFKNQ